MATENKLKTGGGPAIDGFADATPASAPAPEPPRKRRRCSASTA